MAGGTPLKSMDTETVLEAFIIMWVTRYGMPSRVKTDKGPKFATARWRQWCQENGVEHIKTTAYHPQANGMVESLHRQIKDALRAS